MDPMGFFILMYFREWSQMKCSERKIQLLIEHSNINFSVTLKSHHAPQLAPTNLNSIQRYEEIPEKIRLFLK